MEGSKPKRKKYGGRVKGVKNKSQSSVKDLIDKHCDMGEIIAGLAELAKGAYVEKELHDGTRKVFRDKPSEQAAKILIEYRFGKAPQPVEHSGQITEIVVQKKIIS